MEGQLTLNTEAAIITGLKKQVAAVEKRIRYNLSRWFAEHPDVDRINLMVGDRKVGTASRKTAKEDYKVTDADAFDDFALTYGFARVRKSIKPGWLGEVVQWAEENCPEAVDTEVVLDGDWKNFLNHVGDTVTFLDTAEIVDGVEYVPEQPTNDFVIRGCEWGQVAPAIERGMGALLLTGGGEQWE